MLGLTPSSAFSKVVACNGMEEVRGRCWVILHGEERKKGGRRVLNARNLYTICPLIESSVNHNSLTPLLTMLDGTNVIAIPPSR